MSASTKTPSWLRAVEMRPEPNHTLLLVAGQPAVDRIRVPRTEQPLPCNRMRAHATGDLEQCAGALSHLGMGIVISNLGEGDDLFAGQLQPTTTNHSGFSFGAMVPHSATTDLSSQK